MGTAWSVKIIIDNTDTELEKNQVKDQIVSQLITIDRLLSTYKTNSELSKFNQQQTLDWIAVSSDFFNVMVAAREISELSRGAFDVTVAPVVNLWGFGPDLHQIEIPTQLEIDHALQKSGFKNIEIDLENQRLRKLTPEISVDLSAIAKGYAVDQIVLLLEKLDLKEYLVEIGGELRAKGRNANNLPWKVGIEVPSPQLRQVYQAIELTDEAVATSGDYRNFFEIEGQRFAHTINPETGRPVEHTLASVTVIADNSMQADGWATAFMVLGLEQGLAIAEHLKLSVLFISRTDKSFTDHATTAFKRR